MTPKQTAASTRLQLLLLEDDPSIAEAVVFALNRESFDCTVASTVSAALQMLANDRSFAVALLDIGLPDGSGLDVCKFIVQMPYPKPAVLMLSARNEEIDRVVGLELGADDYLGKPFGVRELVARVRALIRRSPPTTVDTAPSLWVHDPTGSRIARAGKWLELTRREYLLLACLLESSGRILSRNQLLDAAWGIDAESDDRTVDTHIKTLRAKLKAQFAGSELALVTHRGLGYQLAQK